MENKESKINIEELLKNIYLDIIDENKEFRYEILSIEKNKIKETYIKLLDYKISIYYYKQI